MEIVDTIPLIEKYKKMYRENPDSKVFAPLADFYRKKGKQNKALVILKEGIKKYPRYILGYLGLANCYFDLGKYELAYDTIKPLVNNNRENIKLQKLFARICERTNRSYEAMETYKYIQFLDPKDEQASKRLVNIDTPIEAAPIENSEGNQTDWVAVDLTSEKPPVKMEIIDKLVGVSVRKKDFNKAFEYLDVSLDLDPNNEWAMNRKKELKENPVPNQELNASGPENGPGKEAKLLKLLNKIHSRASKYKISQNRSF